MNGKMLIAIHINPETEPALYEYLARVEKGARATEAKRLLNVALGAAPATPAPRRASVGDDVNGQLNWMVEALEALPGYLDGFMAEMEQRIVERLLTSGFVAAPGGGAPVDDGQLTADEAAKFESNIFGSGW